jgi:GNAT superfamily N-acetyltransferase
VDNEPVTPERNLSRLLAAIAPRRHQGVWVFCDVPSGCLPEGIEPRLTFVEGDTTTVVLAEEQARAAGLPGALRSVWITLEVDSDLAAVGFLAVITARLAAASISVNVVSAFRHDHLFVPLVAADDAMAALTTLQELHQPVRLVLPASGPGAGDVFEIRPASVEDAPALCDLWELCGLRFARADVEIVSRLALHAGLLMVAATGTTLAGSVWAASDGRRGWVPRLATHPAYRGHGLAGALLAEAERRLALCGQARGS